MTIPPLHVALILAGCAAYFALLALLDRALAGERRTLFRLGAAAATFALYVVGLGLLIDRQAFDHARAYDLTKSMLAILAASAVFFEQHREGSKRPVPERWKRFAGIALGLTAITLYFGGFRFAYPKYYHRWDQYHYYMGAKYFHEAGYDGLYRCTLIAQDELGLVSYVDEDTGKPAKLDMRAEVRHADKKIRNLGGDNLLKPAAEFLSAPEACKARFSPERWESYKADVRFFRLASDKQYWEDMQKDHGFNPPPVWTMVGGKLASLAPASTRFLQALAGLDLAYLAGMFAALAWAFGWRVFAVAAVLWGCQSSAPFFWTGGAFLRQDWLFFLVLSACLARKRYFTLAGASLTFAGLLRVFPALAAFGWIVLALTYLFRHKRPHPSHLRLALGGALALATLVPLSLRACGPDAYEQFYRHTLEVHDRTPLTNHMGLRVLVSHGVGFGPSSGRMAYTRDVKLVDPFEVWKRLRNERYDRYRWVAYGLIGASFLAFASVARRLRSTWVAVCLGQLFIVLMAQLTCYYYSFVVLMAPLTRHRRSLEAPLFAFAALTQFVWMAAYWNDDRYAALSLVTLAVCFGLLASYSRSPLLARVAERASRALRSGD